MVVDHEEGQLLGEGARLGRDTASKSGCWHMYPLRYISGKMYMSADPSMQSMTDLRLLPTSSVTVGI
jgi:hypothetical protein